MMSPKERMTAVSQGEKTDRIPFLPTVFEHSASFIGKTPSEVAVDERLIEEAQLKAYETYGHDSVAVGIDVYNIEAEALGCKIKYHEDNSIPGVLSHPYGEALSIGEIKFSIEKGRIIKILNAGVNIKNKIGSEVTVGIGICGPFSICVELMGYENIIMDCISDEEKVHDILKAALDYQKNYCKEIIKRGLGITIFESWAVPPLISPDMYRKFVAPYEKELISFIKNNGLKAVPLVIGGDTTRIVDDIIETGTTLLVADYSVDLTAFIEKASRKNLLVRGNIDPKLVSNGSKAEIIECVKNTLLKANDYKKFILGTGVIPFDTPKDNILAIKEYIEKK